MATESEASGNGSSKARKNRSIMVLFTSILAVVAIAAVYYASHINQQLELKEQRAYRGLHEAQKQIITALNTARGLRATLGTSPDFSSQNLSYQQLTQALNRQLPNPQTRQMLRQNGFKDFAETHGEDSHQLLGGLNSLARKYDYLDLEEAIRVEWEVYESVRSRAPRRNHASEQSYSWSGEDYSELLRSLDEQKKTGLVAGVEQVKSQISRQLLQRYQFSESERLAAKWLNAVLQGEKYSANLSRCEQHLLDQISDREERQTICRTMAAVLVLESSRAGGLELTSYLRSGIKPFPEQEFPLAPNSARCRAQSRGSSGLAPDEQGFINVAVWQRENPADPRLLVGRCRHQDFTADKKIKNEDDSERGDAVYAAEVKLDHFVSAGGHFDELDVVALADAEGRLLWQWAKERMPAIGRRLYQDTLPGIAEISTLTSAKLVSQLPESASNKELQALTELFRNEQLEQNDIYYMGEKARLYIQRFMLPIVFCQAAGSSEKTKKTAAESEAESPSAQSDSSAAKSHSSTTTKTNQQSFVCGEELAHLIGVRKLTGTDKVGALAPKTFILWFYLVAMFLLLWPWLAIVLSPHKVAIRKSHAVLLVLTLGMAVVLLLNGVLGERVYAGLLKQLERETSRYGEQIAKAWHQELSTVLQTTLQDLNKLEQLRQWREQPEAWQSAGYRCAYESGAGQRSGTFTVRSCYQPSELKLEIVRKVNDQPSPRVLTLGSNMSLFEMEHDGDGVRPVLVYHEPLPQYGHRFNASSRQYFKSVVNRQGWPCDWPACRGSDQREIEQFVIERITNSTDARLASQLAIRLRPQQYSESDLNGNKPVQLYSAEISTQSLEFALALPGVELLVVDNATGMVLFHSADEARVLNEFIHSEIADENALMAAMSRGKETPLITRYRGVPVWLHVRPLPHVPWSLVQVFPLEKLQLTVANMALPALAYMLLPILALGAAGIIALLYRRRISWLWPQWRLNVMYRKASIVIALQTLLLLLMASYVDDGMLIALTMLHVTSVLVINQLLFGLRAGNQLLQSSPWRHPLTYWLLQAAKFTGVLLKPETLSRWQVRALSLWLLLQLLTLSLLLQSKATTTAFVWPFIAFAVLFALMLWTALRALSVLGSESSYEQSVLQESRLRAGHQSDKPLTPNMRFIRYARRFGVWMTLSVFSIFVVPSLLFTADLGSAVSARVNLVAEQTLRYQYGYNRYRLYQTSRLLYPELSRSSVMFKLSEPGHYATHQYFAVSDCEDCAFSFSTEKLGMHVASPFTAYRTLERDPSQHWPLFDWILQRVTTGSDFQAAFRFAEYADAQDFRGEPVAMTVSLPPLWHFGFSVLGDNPYVELFAYALLLFLLALLVYALVSYIAKVVFCIDATIPGQRRVESPIHQSAFLNRELELVPAEQRQEIAELVGEMMRGLPDSHVVTYLAQKEQNQYEAIWRNLSEKEKCLLRHIAAGDLPLSSDIYSLKQLIAKSLVVPRPNFQIINESFGLFILANVDEEMMAEWEYKVRSDAWTTLRWPLGVALVLLLAWMSYFGGDIAQLVTSSMMAAGGLFAAIRQAMSMWKGG